LVNQVGTKSGLPQNIPDCAANILSTMSHPLKIPFQQWTWCMIDTSQMFKKSSFFGVEKPFAESKNNVVILVACSFCTLSFCFHSLWFIL